MSARRSLLAATAALALLLGSQAGAHAALISASVNQTLSGAPISVSFNGVGGFQFTAGSTGYGPGAAVATTGTGKVTTLFGAVTDFAQGSSIDATGLFTFAGYPSPAAIPFSAADDFIGLSLVLNDGVHYGYAEVNGPSLVGVGFESVAGATVQTGDTGAGTGISVTVATPEPASLALLATGLAMLTTRRRGSRRAV